MIRFLARMEGTRDFLRTCVVLVLAITIVDAAGAGSASTRSGGSGGMAALIRHHNSQFLPLPPGVACDFERPCSWQWKNNTTPPGFNVVSGKQLSKTVYELPAGNFTGPVLDANNSSDGHFLFVLITESHPLSQRVVHLTSPKYVATGELCRLEITVAMGRMAGGNFKVVIETVNRTSWVVSEKPCNDKNMWERYSMSLGRISQEFHVIIEVIPGKKTPSYFAIDNLKFVDCFPELPPQQECTGLQFRCSNKVCIDRSRVCDLRNDCLYGEDEEEVCEKMPPFSRCSFEDGWCGWRNVVSKELNWTRHSGKTPTNLTGPSYDHTLQNSTGMYMFVDMSKMKHLGAPALMESAVFNPPPRYHGNKASPYYNSCQIRFHYHMYGPHSGSLTMFLVHLQAHQKVAEGKWYSFGDKGDEWYREVVTLPNITHRYSIQFEGRRGYSSKGDIAVDDFSLSPECFGLGVPPEEVKDYNYYDIGALVEPTQSTVEHESFTNETFFVFGTCSQTGRTGPTPEMCASAYANTPTSVTVLQESPLAGVQKWVVPKTSYYTIIARGASGGQGSAGQGISRGALMRTVVELRTGESLFLLVGQAGSHANCNKNDPKSRCQSLAKTTSLRDAVREVRNMTLQGGGGGGGGGTFVFTVNKRRQRIPLLIAGGGGGLGHGPLEIEGDQIQHGYGTNLSRGNSSGNEYGNTPAGAGGGWDEIHDTRRPARGTALLEGAFGGETCISSPLIGAGGFGGGGGGCTSGGGGGGYSGGDAWSERRRSGQGGFSMVRHDLESMSRYSVGTHDGMGSVIIIPSLDNGACGCDFRCVALDEYRHHTRCICPEGWNLGNDSISCILPADSNQISPITYMIGFIAMTMVALICCGTACMVLYTRYQRKKRAMTRRKMMNGPDLQLNRLRVATNGMMTEYNPNYEFGGGTYTIQDLKEIPRDQLRLVKALGQGAFGEVYQGFYKTRAGDAVEMPVAVKTLPELSSSQAEMDFLMEALIMSKFSHPNIVHFIGVCFDNHPRFIILELLAGGDLKTFLREARPKPDRPSPLTMKDLLLCTIDVAKGCKYMEDNHFIHRDIASRNCLLTTKGPGRVVKIADFGMARDIYRADYYRKGGKAMLPVKWMPPEAFLDGIFTSKTDVWSFGVLMWEVMSLGYMPYTGRGNQEVMQLVTNGGRLEPPTCCPAPVYGIMTQCWHPIPDERPSFGTILERIGYCMQDPDVMRCALPVFHRPPSTERDTTIMRPPAHDASCLHVTRGQGGAGAASDYLVPLALAIEMHSSPSGGSAEHLLGSGGYGCLGDNSWETSFVREAGDEEEEDEVGLGEDELQQQDDDLSSPRSSRALVQNSAVASRAPSSPAPPPPPSSSSPKHHGVLHGGTTQPVSSVSSTESSSDASTSRSTALNPATDDKSSLLSLDNNSFVMNNNNNTSSVAEKLRNDIRANKLPLQSSLSLDASTLSRQHTPVLPPPLQYANVSPNSISSGSETAESPPPPQLPAAVEHRRPYSVQTTTQSRRLLADNEISC